MHGLLMPFAGATVSGEHADQQPQAGGQGEESGSELEMHHWLLEPRTPLPGLQATYSHDTFYRAIHVAAFCRAESEMPRSHLLLWFVSTKQCESRWCSTDIMTLLMVRLTNHT